MDQSLIFWPMIAHAFLVMAVYLELGRRRYVAGKAGLIKSDDYKIYRGDREPESCAKAARNLVNNFELPVLFHVVALALYLTDLAFYPQLVLAWLFVASRYAHSLVHLTANNVGHRAFWFLVGLAVLIVMWALFALNLATGAV